MILVVENINFFFGSAIGYVQSNIAAIAFLTLSVTAIGFGAGGMVVNHLDIGGPLAGILMGVANTSGSVAGIVGERKLLTHCAARESKTNVDISFFIFFFFFFKKKSRLCQHL